MSLRITPSNRFCNVQNVQALRPDALKRALLARHVGEADFQLIDVPAPAYDDTRFAVAGNGKDILVAVAMYDSLNFLPAGNDSHESLEILFDTHHDRLGYTQFIFSPQSQTKGYIDDSDPHRDQEVLLDWNTNTFNPYPDADSSSGQSLTVKKFKWE